MQWRRLALVSSLGLLAAIAISGCGRGTLATVNGDKISKDEFYRRIERTSMQELVTNSGGKNFQVGAFVLQQMINEKLWAQIAKDKKVEPTDKDVDVRIKQLEKQGLQTRNLQAAGMTMDELKQIVRRDLIFYNVVTNGITVSDSEAKAFYDKWKDRSYTRPEQVQIAGIVCNDRPKIDQAYKKVKDGADFGTIALSMSVDTVSKSRKGVMGYVFYGEPKVPKVVIDQAFAIKHDTEISAPFYVKDSNQWVLLKRLSRQSRRVSPFVEVKDQIHRGLMMRKAELADSRMHISNMLSQKRKTAKIVIKSDRYRSIGSEKKT